jgi:hypothetical protein
MTISREARIGIGVTALAILAMAVDHLMGDDPGLEDPPAFLIASGLSLALAAFLFGRIVPRATKTAPPERRARDGLICSVLAVVPGIATVWLGLPFILAGAGLALGLHARQERPSRRATAAIVIGALALLAGTGGYAALAIDKLGSSESAGRDFARADLARLGFAPDELRGLEYQRESSGAGAFSADQKEEAREEGDRSGLELLKHLNELGLEADHVSQFFATSRGSEFNFVESIVFLFRDGESAEAAVAAVRRGAARNIAPAAQIDAPTLGEQAFALRGEFEGFPTYTFAWRTGDVIQMLGVAPRERDAGPEGSRQLAQKLAGKAEE